MRERDVVVEMRGTGGELMVVTAFGHQVGDAACRTMAREKKEREANRRGETNEGPFGQ